MFRCGGKRCASLLIAIVIFLTVSPTYSAIAQNDGGSEGAAYFRSAYVLDSDGFVTADNLRFIDDAWRVSAAGITGVDSEIKAALSLTGASARMTSFYEHETVMPTERVPYVFIQVESVLLDDGDGKVNEVATNTMMRTHTARFTLRVNGREEIELGRNLSFFKLPLFEGDSVLEFTYASYTAEYTGRINITYTNRDPFVAQTLAYVPKEQMSEGEEQRQSPGAFTLCSGGDWGGKYIHLLPCRVAAGGVAPFNDIEGVDAGVNGASGAQGADAPLAVSAASVEDMACLSAMTGVTIVTGAAAEEKAQDARSKLMLNAAGALGTNDAATLNYTFMSGGKCWTSALDIVKEKPAGNTNGTNVTDGTTASEPGGSGAREACGLAVLGLSHGDTLERGRDTVLTVAPVDESGAVYAADEAFRARFGYLRTGSLNPDVCFIYPHAPDGATLNPLSAGRATLRLWYDGNGAYRTYEEAPAMFRLDFTVTVGKSVEDTVREMLEAYYAAGAAPQETKEEAASTFDYGHVVCTRLNIREEPTTKSRAVGRLQRWDAFIVGEAVDGAWYAIDFKGGTGYIAADYTVTQPYGGEVFYVATKSSTRLYGAASTSSRKLASLKRNTHLLCTGESGAYYIVLLGGREAYVPKKHVNVL